MHIHGTSNEHPNRNSPLEPGPVRREEKYLSYPEEFRTYLKIFSPEKYLALKSNSALKKYSPLKNIHPEEKYLCPLLSSSYPEEFRPYRPQIPPPFTQIGPRQAPTDPANPSHLFSHFEFNESSQTREEGIINFLSLKKTRLTHIC